VVDDVAVSRTVVDVANWQSKLRAADEMIRDLAGLLREVDVVHLHGYSSKNVLVTAVATMSRVPIVMSLHTAGFDEPASIAGHGRIARWTFDAARLYLCVSLGLADACRAGGVPPDRIRTEKVVAANWNGPAAIDLKAFRPAGVQRMFVLGGAAGISREAAAKLLRPTALIEAGTRIGAAAADDAKRIVTPAAPQVRGVKAVRSAGDVKESLTGLRNMDENKPRIDSPARSLPVLGSYDVVVIGGGTGGAAAAIGAGRKGAKTLVVEYLSGLGGVGTFGLITSYYWGYRGGFSKEVPGERIWNPFERAEWWRRTARTAGAEVWFGVLGCAA
jgi:hypothetical protein